MLLASVFSVAQTRRYLGRPSAIGFDWRHHTLLWLMGGLLAPCQLCPLAAPMFLLLGILVGGPRIQKRIYRGGVCHMGFGWQPCALLLSMGGALVLHHHHPLAALLLRHLGLLMGGHLSPPLLLVCIVGGLHSPPLLLGLRGPWGLHISRLFWGALLLWPFLQLSLVRSRMFYH